MPAEPVEKIYEESLLYDFYGELLQDSQKKVVELYVNDDLSLSESADLLGISRQGVRDSLDRACRNLREYEEKLGLLKAYNERRERDSTILSLLSELRHSECCEEVLPQIELIEELLKGDD